MYLSKNAKKFLYAAQTVQPDRDGFIEGVPIADSIQISYHEADRIVDYLEQENLIKRRLKTRPDLFELTELGSHYRRWRTYITAAEFVRSFLCPIVVSLITSLIVTLLTA